MKKILDDDERTKRVKGLIKLDFEIKVLLATFVISVICGLITIPILKKLKVGQIERDDGPASHLKKQGTPTMGGIIMIIAIIIAVTGSYIFLAIKGNQDLGKKLLPLLLLAIGFGMIGFIDDFKKLVLKNTEGLKPSYKMLGLLIIAVVYVLFLVQGLKLGTETYIPIFKMYINIPVFIYIPLAIIVILATTNAVNLTDGIDGLSSSVSAIIITCLTVIGISNQIYEVSIFGSIVIGSVLGFLIFNLHPAKVFMGDTGSLALGGSLAAIAILTRHELSLAVVDGVFVIETLSSLIQIIAIRKFHKKVFKMAPLHHHFEKLGWEENDIVKLFWIVGLILAMLMITYNVWL